MPRSTRSRNLEWRDVTRHNFALPDAAAFFDEVREELENGSGMVKMCGLDVSRYSQEQLRRIWYGIGCHLGTPMYQNRRGEVMRDIRDEGMGVAAKLYGATIDASGKQFLSSGARTLSVGAVALSHRPLRRGGSALRAPGFRGGSQQAGQ